MDLRTAKTVQERRELIEKITGVSLSHTGRFSLDETVASTRHCENMIGATQIPLGVAGPLRIRSSVRFPELKKSQFRESNGKDYHLPLATTEGALVASVNRGCRAITESGGAMVTVENMGATRGPVFRTRGISESLALKVWLDRNFSTLDKAAQSTSHHISLKKIGTQVVGNHAYVRFSFDTQDAMGLNMVTIAVDSMIQIIESKTKARCISIAGNYDVDKKPAWLNAIAGRGKRVWAEVVLSKPIVSSVLKTTPDRFFQTWLSKCMVGSALSGSMGFNAQFANVLSAIFIATGQDPAHIAECAVGMTTAEIVPSSFRPLSRNLASIHKIPGQARDDKKPDGDLYVSVYLPDLMVGTVGGGTGLATQKEALEILGVAGGNDGKNTEKFAEIVGAAVLAGEISLLASLSQGTLAQAHERLARGQISK